MNIKRLLALILHITLYATGVWLFVPATAIADGNASTPILIVDGAVAPKADGSANSFSLDQLIGLPKSKIVTSNPWDKQTVTYEGVKIADILDAVHATGTVLHVHALNDYASDIPVADVRAYGLLLAYLRNGKTMSIEDRGPLFVVYPFSTKPELYNEMSFSRSVWQVDRITVK